MHLVFSSDSDSNWQGFSLNFTSVYSPLLDEPTTPSCGNNSACNGGKYIATLSGSGAYVSSSGYPSYYDNNLSCTWLVYSESQVKTNNLHVVLAANGDYLMFFDGPSQDFMILKIYTRYYDSASTFYSTGNYMFVQIVTGDSRSDNGFYFYACTYVNSTSLTAYSGSNYFTSPN